MSVSEGLTCGGCPHTVEPAQLDRRSCQTWRIRRGQVKTTQGFICNLYSWSSEVRSQSLDGVVSGIQKIERFPFTVSRRANVKQVLVKINENRGCPCIITDESNRCFGIVSDGDIRRFLLAGNNLDEPVTCLEDPFHSVPPSTTAEGARVELLSTGIRFLPIIAKGGEIVGVWNTVEDRARVLFSQPVLVLAGGKGTRLKPLTLTTPKPLIKVGNRTLLDRTIDKFASDGFRNIFLSVNYLREKVIDHLEESGLASALITVIEEDQPLGTAGPVALLPTTAEGDLLVVNADVIHGVDLAKMMATHLS